MASLLDTSPLLILLALAVVSWLTGSRVVRFITLLFFFGYPLMQGKTTISSFNINQIMDFILNTVNYWLTELLNTLLSYII